MASHWASDHIGEAWTEEHDCWAFFRRMQSIHFSREVPAVGYDVGNLLSCAHALSTGKQAEYWRHVDTPQEGDAVLMGKNRRPSHIGIWVEIDGGGILHCQRKSGVVFTDIQRTALCGWQHVEFYRYQP